nr:unnamed protein product [Callosobruchus analis]
MPILAVTFLELARSPNFMTNPISFTLSTLLNTRCRNEICLEKFNHSFFMKSPDNAGCRLFNLLPIHIRATRNYRYFRHHLRQLLIECTPYTISEFTNFIQNISASSLAWQTSFTSFCDLVQNYTRKTKMRTSLNIS